jgi:hypothetical protein
MLRKLWITIASVILRRKKKMSIDNFRAYFKLSVPLVDFVWEKLKSSFPSSRPKYLLWALHFMKTTATNMREIAEFLGTTEQTLRKQVKITLSRLYNLLPNVSFIHSLTHSFIHSFIHFADFKFNFSSRFKGWDFLSPSCVVDSTFVRIKRPYMRRWEYYSREKHDFGMVYQIVGSLGKPFRILSFEGPFKASAADVSIFRTTILPKMKEEEKILGDKGYRQEKKCWCPPTGNINKLSTEEKKSRRKVTMIRQIVERLIGRLKCWGCFKKRWNSSWKLHNLCSFVAAKLTQLELYTYPLK